MKRSSNKAHFPEYFYKSLCKHVPRVFITKFWRIVNFMIKYSNFYGLGMPYCDWFTYRQCSMLNCNNISCKMEVLTVVTVKIALSGMLHHVIRWMITSVQEEPAASIFRVTLLPWVLKQQVPRKCYYWSTNLKGIASQKTVIFNTQDVMWKVINRLMRKQVCKLGIAGPSTRILYLWFVLKCFWESDIVNSVLNGALSL
jgi:hypothetical protein